MIKLTPVEDYPKDGRRFVATWIYELEPWTEMWKYDIEGGRLLYYCDADFWEEVDFDGKFPGEICYHLIDNK